MDIQYITHCFLIVHMCRAIISLQNRRDHTQDRGSGTRVSRREDTVEYRVGRLKHERVKVPRGDNLLSWAMQVMRHHAERKSVLEVSSPRSFLYRHCYDATCTKLSYLYVRM